MERRDALARERERRAQLRGAARDRVGDLVLADPQAGDARVVAIEAPGVVEQRRIALGRDPGDDRRDLGADIDLLRLPAAHQAREVRGKARRAVVEALGHGSAPLARRRRQIVRRRHRGR